MPRTLDGTVTLPVVVETFTERLRDQAGVQTPTRVFQLLLRSDAGAPATKTAVARLLTRRMCCFKAS
jgi:hypothetical protein